MEEILRELAKWREERGLDKIEFNLDMQVSFLLDEVKEYLQAKTKEDKIDELCDIVIFTINAGSLLGSALEYKGFNFRSNIGDVIHKISFLAQRGNRNDIIVQDFCTIIDIVKVIITNMDYIPERCILEKIKKISSRVGKVNPASGKWEKDKNQDPKTLYVPNYEACKLCR